MQLLTVKEGFFIGRKEGTAKGNGRSRKQKTREPAQVPNRKKRDFGSTGGRRGWGGEKGWDLGKKRGTDICHSPMKREAGSLLLEKVLGKRGAASLREGKNNTVPLSSRKGLNLGGGGLPGRGRDLPGGGKTSPRKGAPPPKRVV